MIRYALAVALFGLCLIEFIRADEPDKAAASSSGMTLKTESFDRDPGWSGANNRIARTREPRRIRQDFGFSQRTRHAGGMSAGEIGGFVTPAGEAAFYGKILEPATLEEPLSASGTLSMGQGGTHLLLGFFNAATVNEWRTPNTVALRLNGRGDRFYAYVEYCTSKWRAGGDTTPFPLTTDPKSGRASLIGFPCNTSLHWSLTYDPKGSDGRGRITAKIGDATAFCKVEDSHKKDGATFNRFGVLNVVKSADSGSEAWFDDIRINGGAAETFDQDPIWDARNNRATIASRIVRPWFDFGFSDTHFAGGTSRGELGGQIFRGDCRDPERMACYGDRIGPLTLDKPLKASGKIAMTRGVSDSTTLFGFYNARDGMRHNDSQSDGLPESVLGAQIEGPSSEGFKFYPVLRAKGSGSQYPAVRTFPTIYPDAKSHQWSLAYHPADGGRGQITVTLDGDAHAFEINIGGKKTTFDRFGIVTTWIDGNRQVVFFDDLTYTVQQQ
jgi:hypothetical protein